MTAEGLELYDATSRQIQPSPIGRLSGMPVERVVRVVVHALTARRPGPSVACKPPLQMSFSFGLATGSYARNGTSLAARRMYRWFRPCGLALLRLAGQTPIEFPDTWMGAPSAVCRGRHVPSSCSSSSLLEEFCMTRLRSFQPYRASRVLGVSIAPIHNVRHPCQSRRAIPAVLENDTTADRARSTNSAAAHVLSLGRSPRRPSSRSSRAPSSRPSLPVTTDLGSYPTTTTSPTDPTLELQLRLLVSVSGSSIPAMVRAV